MLLMRMLSRLADIPLPSAVPSLMLSVLTASGMDKHARLLQLALLISGRPEQRQLLRRTLFIRVSVRLLLARTVQVDTLC